MLRRSAIALLALAALPHAAVAQESIVISNVSIIDATGAPMRGASTVRIENGLISAVDAASSNRDGPEAAVEIDGSGKYLVPGFIDSNVHASIYGNSRRRETVVKYGERNDELVLEFVQRQLQHGVTTVRDSYGSLEPLSQVRDRIERGEAIGSRLLIAGNIVGWGGPFSITFSLMQESDLTLFQAMWNDSITQGVGEDLMDMGPEEVRDAINDYLDKGVNFVKYGGTSHFESPSLIGFSPRVQKVIVDETHKRGLIAETHSTSPEALRMSVEAGIDLIQHPEILSRDYPDDLIDLIVGRDVICAMRSNTLAGEPWRTHLENRKKAEEELRDAAPPKTSAERRERERRLNERYEIQRRNAERLIAAGCRVTIATDNYQGQAPEFRREPKPEIQEAGIGSLLAIEGLVELGMTEMEALIAGTRNGAAAAGMSDSIGTIEVGKIADVVLLRENPLDDIANIRQIEHVIARGRLVDLDSLPENGVFYPRAKSAGRVAPAAMAPAAAAPIAAAVPAASEPELVEEVPAGAAGENILGDALAIESIDRAPRGNLIVALDNGQRWRQLDSDNTRVILPQDSEALTASVQQSFMGSVTMKIEGTNRSFKVSRVE